MSPNLFRFADFELNVEGRELRRFGNKIPLQNQPLRILAMLLQHRGTVVTRQQLCEQIWPADTYVDFERGLNTAMKKLRRVLADDPENPRFIETIPRYGYRFIGEIQQDSSAPINHMTVAASVELSSTNETHSLARPIATSSGISAFAIPKNPEKGRAGRLSLILVVATLALAAVGWSARGWVTAWAFGPSIKSVAVLPLENLTGDSRQDYLVDGITDALITSVAQIHSIDVISRTSVMPYKGSKMPLSQIARELKVDAIVEGTVSEANGRLRVNAQLIRADTDTHLWAGQYDGQLSDLLTVQTNVTQEIAQQIRANVGPVGILRSKKNAPSEARVSELYLRGRYFWNKRGPEDLNKAIDYFRQTLEADASFAPAYAGLADSYTLQILNGVMTREEGVPKARAAALKATALDDNLPETHTALGGIASFCEWNWPAAAREFKRAIELNPSYAPAHHWYADLYLAPMGRLDEALAEINRAHELDPLNKIILTDLGHIFYLRKQYLEAQRTYERVLDLDANFVPAHYRMAQLYERMGRYADAVREMATDARLAYGAEGEQMARDWEKAFQQAGFDGVVRAQVKNFHSKDFDSGYILGEAYLRLGDYENAFPQYSRAIQEREPILIYLAVEPAYEPLRGDRRFQDLVRRIGLRNE